MSLREKFEALRQFVEGIPADRLNMDWIDVSTNGAGCGCVLHHLPQGSPLYKDIEGIATTEERNHLYGYGVKGNSYPIPTGQPAKDEFLRRLDVLKEKYCGSSKESPS